MPSWIITCRYWLLPCSFRAHKN